MLVDVEWVEDFASFVSLEKIRATESLAEMKLLQKGSRLSISPVTAAEFKTICKMGKAKAGKKA
jgi:predicted RNA-binding protein with PUA-like domain